MNLITRAYAAILPTITPANTGTGNYATVGSIIQFAITWIIYVAGALAVIYLIYSGILYITAAGNPDAAKKGQQGIVNAIIGLVIIVLAYVIVNVIVSAVSGGSAPS